MLTAIKGEINNNTILVGDFNTSLSPKERSSKRKIKKETQPLNDTLNIMNLIDIYRTFHPKITEYTFFLSAYGTFSRTNHILGHKSRLGKFKKIYIVSIIFSDQNAKRLDVNYRKKTVKNTNTWRLNHTLLITKRSLKKSKRKSKNTYKQMTMKTGDPKPIRCNKSSSKREVYSNTILVEETRNISNKQPNLTAKPIRERRTKKPNLGEGKKS